MGLVTGDMSEDDLVSLIKALPAWKTKGDFSEEEWGRYFEASRMVQKSRPEVIERALDRVVSIANSDPATSDETQSKPFLLLRTLFALPERVPADEQASFKGWTNWPKPDAAGFVNPSWPISWANGKPALTASYEGSMGLPYAAGAEYQHLRKKYEYRKF
jgi:hypothetical protein